MILSFVWVSFSHSSCTLHASSFSLIHIFFFFPSFLLIHLSIRDKKGESIPVCFIITIWLMCTFLGGRNSTPCTFIGEMHILRGRRHLFWENLVLSCFTLCLFSHCLWCFELHLVSMLCCFHRIVLVLDMHTSLC